MSNPPDPARLLAPARIRDTHDQPYSLDFGDIYHATDGAAEVQRVFVGPCGLPALAARRARRTHPGRRVVRVGEIGFGSGLNFVVAAQTCLAAGVRLRFLSCEARPLDAADFGVIARRRSAAHPLYAELAALYPPHLRGWHQRVLAGGRVVLMLWLGEAGEALADLRGRQRQPLDAWFLDGFAPDRNPSAWAPELFDGVAALSGPGTRVATFTAAGRVRRGLTAVGFAMQRLDQRPYKRESLAGTFQADGVRGFDPPRHVLVAGAGLAGASAAWHLAEAGVPVSVTDPGPGGPDPPPGSRIPATVLHARLLADGSAVAGLRWHAYLYAAARVRSLDGYRRSGVLQLAGASDRGRLEALAQRYGAGGTGLRWLSRSEAAELAAWPVPGGGLWLADAGIVDTPALVRVLLARAAAPLRPEALTTLPDQASVVLACGPAVHRFDDAGYLEVVAVQGQIDLVALAAPPTLPLVGARYLVPGAAGLAAGATYEHRPWDPERASRANLAQLDGVAHTWLGRVRGTRSVSSDRTAIVGPLFDATGRPSAHVYVSTGHGSAGNVSAHLAGAVLAAHLTGDCPPLERGLEALLSPARFRARQARRGRRHGAT